MSLKQILKLRQIFYEETDEENGLSISDLQERLSDYGIKVSSKTVRSYMKLLRENDDDIVLDYAGKNSKYHIDRNRGRT